MPQQDTSELKEKIISFIKINGPSLPVHIAGYIGMTMLFTSAFLSELLSEKKLKISNMKVGSSPLYLLFGQEGQLEKYSQHLKSREKDAFTLLKEKEILKDTEQEPAIKVALRAIKDFAIPIQKNNELYWRYINSEKEVEERKEDTSQENNLIKEVKKEFEKKEPKVKKTIKKKTSKISDKKNEKFFNNVKEYLSNKRIEISDIVSFNKKELILKIIENGEEELLIAHNKKRIEDKDLVKASKKASEFNLNYVVYCLGEPLKKLTSLIDAIKKLKKIEKIG